MCLGRGSRLSGIALSLGMMGASFGVAQESVPPTQTTSAAPASSQSGTEPAEAAAPAPAKKQFIVPAGTKVLLQLRSAINTRSAKPGDGVYLASTFPVVVGNRVMIPAGVYVQGTVDRVERA